MGNNKMVLEPGKLVRAKDEGISFTCELIYKEGDLWAVHVHGANARRVLGTHRCKGSWRDSELLRHRFADSASGWWITEADISFVESKVDA